MANVQEFLGDVKVDGVLNAEKLETSGSASVGTNLTVIGRVDANDLRVEELTVGAPTRTIVGKLDVTMTISSGALWLIGCAGTINTIGTGVKTIFIIGSPGIIVNANASTKTYRDGYAVGAIYQTTGEDSPALVVGGNWEKLTADAYFKIVTSGAGATGGTSGENKIPISSLPSHNFVYAAVVFGDVSFLPTDYTGGNWIGTKSATTNTIGGNEAYYPYYYGVYAWRRINVGGQE